MRDPLQQRMKAADEWKPCPNCRTPMVPLRDFEISDASEGPSLHADHLEFMLYGWWAYVYNFFFGAKQLQERKQKLATTKARILPQFPNSLICSRCLYVEERK